MHWLRVVRLVLDINRQPKTPDWEDCRSYHSEKRLLITLYPSLSLQISFDIDLWEPFLWVDCIDCLEQNLFHVVHCRRSNRKFRVCPSLQMSTLLAVQLAFEGKICYGSLDLEWASRDFHIRLCLKYSLVLRSNRTTSLRKRPIEK